MADQKLTRWALVASVAAAAAVGATWRVDPTDLPDRSGVAGAPASATAEKVWPRWDPRVVDDLPAAPDEIAPALPEEIDPPPSSPLLAEEPVGPAVLAVEHGGVAQVLGTTGDWRTVPIAGRHPVLALSPDGTRLAVHYGYDPRTPAHDYGVTVHDLGTGRSRTVEPPAGFEPWDIVRWVFLDRDTLLLSSGPSSYVVAADSGEAEEVAVPVSMSIAVDPDGGWLSSADFDQPNVLTDHSAGTLREVTMERTSRLLRIQAGEDTVIGTTHEGFSVVVADRETLTPQVRLPVLDHEANYSNWGLAPAAVADDGTVLLRVAAIGRRVDGFRLVAWDPAEGGLSVVSSTDLPVESSVVFAGDLLRVVDAG